MIDLSTIEKLPDDFQNLIVSHRNNLINEFRNESAFLQTEQRYHRGFPTPIKDNLKSELKELLKDKDFKSYHSTRIINEDEILKSGLRYLRIEEQKSKVTETLTTYLSKKEMQLLTECFNSTNISLGQREGQIWFLPDLRMAESECGILREFYGGEAISRMLYDHKILFDPILKKIGTPMIIECKIKINDLDGFHFDNLTDRIIDEIVGVHAFINWEFYLEKDIPQRDILNIIKL